MSRRTPPTYKTQNWLSYNKALKDRGSLTIWFDPAMTWEATSTGKRGRQRNYSDAAIQTCLTMKVLFGMVLRQTTGFVESLLRLIGLDWDVPDFSTLSRRQKTLKVKIPYRGSDGPLHLLVDSTGIKVEGEGEWNARKHGGLRRRVWRKVHIGIDEKTLKIRAAEFTASDVGDVPMLPELLGQIPSEQQVATVTADGAFDTRKCHEAIAARGAAAIIPPRKNATLWKPDNSGATARNDILRTSKRIGRTIWRRWSGYHRRSRVETKMHCLKLLGQRLSARDVDRQVAEFQVRVIRHCRSDQWRQMAHSSTASLRSGSLSRKPSHKSIRGKGGLGPQLICATEPPQPEAQEREERDAVAGRVRTAASDGDAKASKKLGAIHCMS